MKITINLNKFGKTINALINEGLKKKNIPECFANMVPPIVENFLDVEDTSVFSSKDITPGILTAIENISPIIVEDNEVEIFKKNKKSTRHNSNFVLTRERLDELDKIKTKRASDYVDQVTRCITCPHVDLCYKLTVNYVRAITLEQQERLLRKPILS